MPARFTVQLLASFVHCLFWKYDAVVCALSLDATYLICFGSQSRVAVLSSYVSFTPMFTFVFNTPWGGYGIRFTPRSYIFDSSKAIDNSPGFQFHLPVVVHKFCQISRGI